MQRVGKADEFGPLFIMDVAFEKFRDDFFCLVRWSIDVINCIPWFVQFM